MYFARLLLKQFGCEGRLLLKHFECKGTLLFKHFKCKITLLFQLFGCKARLLFEYLRGTAKDFSNIVYSFGVNKVFDRHKKRSNFCHLIQFLRYYQIHDYILYSETKTDAKEFLKHFIHVLFSHTLMLLQYGHHLLLLTLDKTLLFVDEQWSIMNVLSPF